MDLKRWDIFRNLDTAFMADVNRAYLVGIDSTHDLQRAAGKGPKSVWRGALMAMKNGDVYSIALTWEDLGLLGANESESLLPLVPVKMEALCGHKIRDVTSSREHVVLLTMDGRVYQWGDLNFGNTPLVSREPRVVLGALQNQQVAQIACGHQHTVILTKDGQVYWWGIDPMGYAVGITNFEVDPVKIVALNGFDAKIAFLACSGWACFALDVAGSVWSWGRNNGALGYCSSPGFRDQLSPRRVTLPCLTTIKKIVAGNLHVLALTTENEVYFWGRHLKEELTVNPKKIQISNVKDVAAIRGCSVSSVETFEGKVYFWGYAYGHLIPEPTLTEFSSMHEVFPSLDSPMMLKSLQPELKQSALAKRLGASFDDEETGDVKFCVEGKLIYAHKVFLKLRNDHFKRMFENNWKENGEEAIVEIANLQYKDFRSFLFYLYTDRIQPITRIAQDVLELIKIADYYGEEDLKRRCGQQLKVLTTSENFGQVYSVAVLFNAKVLEELAVEFAVPNLNAIMKTAAYKKMPDELKVRLMDKLADRDVFVGLKDMGKK